MVITQTTHLARFSQSAIAYLKGYDIKRFPCGHNILVRPFRIRESSIYHIYEVDIEEIKQKIHLRKFTLFNNETLFEQKHFVKFDKFTLYASFLTDGYYILTFTKWDSFDVRNYLRIKGLLAL